VTSQHSLEGKVALVTGAARGQGRSHACALASRGAKVVAMDIAGPISTVEYDAATEEDLATTARMIAAGGGSIRLLVGDVRRRADTDAAVALAFEAYGSLDLIVANAGIVSYVPSWAMSEEQWSEVIDINLNGVWRTISSAVPRMIEQGRGGSIVITSSTAGLRGVPNIAHYCAAKHGVVGLMKALAVELAPYWIRVNCVHPTSVLTPMLTNEVTARLFCPDLDSPTIDDAKDRMRAINALPVPWCQPSDVSNAVTWLCSDLARLVTGVSLPVDAGASAK